MFAITGRKRTSITIDGTEQFVTRKTTTSRVGELSNLLDDGIAVNSGEGSTAQKHFVTHCIIALEIVL